MSETELQRYLSAAWNKGLVSGIAFALRLENNVNTWEPTNPYEEVRNGKSESEHERE